MRPKKNRPGVRRDSLLYDTHALGRDLSYDESWTPARCRGNRCLLLCLAQQESRSSPFASPSHLLPLSIPSFSMRLLLSAKNTNCMHRGLWHIVSTFSLKNSDAWSESTRHTHRNSSRNPARHAGFARALRNPTPPLQTSSVDGESNLSVAHRVACDYIICYGMEYSQVHIALR